MRGLYSLLVLCVSGNLCAQSWSGILAPSRAVDWSNVGITGGTPNRTTICATLDQEATAAQINSAIADCPAGEVVFLGAGTYNLSSGIDFKNKSDVTLRGAGADQTKLVFGPGAAVPCHGFFANVCIDSSDTNWPRGPSNLATWTAGYDKGVTQITLSNTDGLSVGDPIILDQLNDISDNGLIYVCDTVAGGCTNEGPSGGQRKDRAQQQIVTVAELSENQVTISPGLYMSNWSSDKSPEAWWASSPIFNVGIETLSLDHSASNEQAGITIFNCSGCWVKGIRSLNSNRTHVWVYANHRTVVRDSYFYGTKKAVSQSYGVECYVGSSDMLIENNIFQHVTAPQMINSACSGTVIAYNYSIDNHYTASSRWMQQSAHMHSGGIDNLLLEGNMGAGMRSDNFHGSHHFVTLFRNYYDGWEAGKSDNLIPLFLNPYSRFYNIIGNVLGRSGTQTTYEFTPPCGRGRPIYILGTCNEPYVKDDPVTPDTIMRWGNYDTVSQAVRFVASEVPSALNQFANPVPDTQMLPASLYLSAKPSWWSSNIPWPAIGPDVESGTGPGGHAYDIPAKVCYDITSKADDILNFSATNCYGTL